MDLTDREWVQEVLLGSTDPASRDQPRLLQHFQVLHHTETGHRRESGAQAGEGLAIVGEQIIEQDAAVLIGQGSEREIVLLGHPTMIGDQSVTYQVDRLQIPRLRGTRSV